MAGLPDTIVAQVSSAASSGDLKFHQGLVLSWNSNTGANVVRIAGTDVPNVQVLTSAGLVNLTPGDPVMVWLYKTTYFVVGRVTGVNNPIVQPQWPIVLYPLFNPVGTNGLDFTAAAVNAGVKATWEGRIRVAHPLIEVDGIWGNLSGTGNNTYQLKLDNSVVGQWTTTGGVVVNHGSVLAGITAGGFDCSAFLGRDWLGIQVSISANGSSGVVAHQPLGVFFRQT
jgi:hypothetical protein